MSDNKSSAKGSYFYDLSYYETDYWSLIPTAHLLRLAMHAMMQQTDAESLSVERIHGELGFFWMMARARFYQSAPIYSERKLEVRVSGRSIDRGTYVRGIDFYSEGEPVARCELASIAVNAAERRILRPQVVEDMWQHPEAPQNTLQVPRLNIKGELDTIRKYAVSYRDCDYNGHFNSSNYIDLVSELGGFYEGEPKIMEYLQIDYNSEALPGRTLVLLGRTRENSGVIRGEHESGAVCFCSEYRMKNI